MTPYRGDTYIIDVAKTFTLEEVVEMMRKRQGGRSNAALARDLGVTRVYIGDIYHGRCAPGPKVLKALGIVATTKVETIYRKASQARVAQMDRASGS